MIDFATIVVTAKRGDRIRVSALSFIKSEAQVQLLSKADFKSFKRSDDNGDDPVVLNATAMKILTPKAAEWTVNVETADDWHIIFQPGCANIVAAKIP